MDMERKKEVLSILSENKKKKKRVFHIIGKKKKKKKENTVTRASRKNTCDIAKQIKFHHQFHP